MRLSTAVAITGALLLAGAVGAFWPRYLVQPLSTFDRYTHLHAKVAYAMPLMFFRPPLKRRAPPLVFLIAMILLQSMWFLFARSAA